MTTTTKTTSPSAQLSHNDYNSGRYQRYAYFRAMDPITWDPDTNSWLVFKYKDVSKLARSANVCTNYLVQEKLLHLRESNKYINDIYNTITKWMIYNEDLDHKRLRKFSNIIFSKENIENFKALIHKAASNALSDCRGKETIDFVRDFAHTVPAVFLKDVIGLDEIDVTTFIMWSDSIADFMQDFVVLPTPRLDVAEQAAKHMHAMKEAFRKAIYSRQANPKNDILSLMISENKKLNAMSEEEFVCQLIHLIFGGHKIPEFIVANSLNCALTNEYSIDQFMDSDFVGQFVEESMRYESPIQFITRHATDDFEYEGISFKKGDSIYLMLGSANRDEEKFTDAEEFQIGRDGPRGLYYGSGVHACIGAALAGMELKEIFRCLGEQIKSITPLYDCHNPEWSKNATFHGVVSMPMRIEWK